MGDAIKYTPKPKPVYFAERVRKDGATDSGARGPELFPNGEPRYPVARPKIAKPDALTYSMRAELMNRGDYFNEYLENIPGGAKKFVAEQEANYRRDDPDGVFADKQKRKNSVLGVNKEAPDPLIDFEKRKKPVMVYEDLNGVDRGHYDREKDSVRGVSVVDIFNKDLVDEKLKGMGLGSKPPESSHLVSTSPSKRVAYNGVGNSSDDDENRNTLFHELAHSFTSAAEKEAQVDKTAEKSPDMKHLEEVGTYNTTNNAEYAQSVLTGLNSMRSITGHKLNDPQSIHQLFDEVEKNPKILNKISEEGGRIFRSYFHLKETNPWAAKKLREATARDSKYLAENETRPPGLEDETRSMVRNYFSSRDNPSVV